ncbi:oligosaccharide flippase family protein [Candidatus Roizmanbacteria bacterium]|nr:oligosaccharide flippase family protein [Candidatus Roizmanbacteria bacterium]
MKIAFIFVLYKTPISEVERLKKEIKTLHVTRYKSYFIDNTILNRGYAAGVNAGLKKALKDGCDLFIIANPDISLNRLNEMNLLEAKKHFDIWGFAMNQDGKTYFGGEIDRWRMSGGLIVKKPRKRFQPVDFVSGSLMVIKKSVIDKIGFLDTTYFLYYEEVDYCYRARLAELKVGIDSNISYDHFEVSKTNSSKNYYLFKNRVKFLLKYGTIKQKFREFLRLPKTIYEEILKRPFYLNFFSLNFSSLVNKVLHFFLFLMLIRYFRPEDYAIYTLAWTHIGLLLPLLDFGTTSYGLVNLVNQNDRQSSTLFSFRAVLSLLTCLLTIGLAFLFNYQTELILPIILTSFVIFANMFSGSFLIFASVAQKSYLVSLVSMIFQIILVISLILGIVFSKKLMIVFWLIFILYNLYSVVNFYLLKKQVKNLKFVFDPRSWFRIGAKSIVFLIISLLAGFYSKVDVLLLNFIKGEKAVGIYSAGYRFLDALMFIVSAYNVSSMTLLSKLAKTSKSEFLAKIKRDLVLVLAIGGLTALGLYFLSPIILPRFLKGDYSLSIQVLRIIIFSLPLILLTSIALNGLYGLKKAKWVIGLFIFQLIFNTVGNLIFIPLYSYFASAYVSLIGETINVLVSFIILRKAINENFR